MSHYADSRDPNGLGYPILQDFGYLDDKLPDHARGSIVGIRVTGRATGDNELGEWIPDDFTRGPIGGAHFWDRRRENAGDYRFAWPCVTASKQATTTSATEPTGGGSEGTAPSDASSGPPKPPWAVGVLAGKDPWPTLSDGSPDWEKIYQDAASGKTEGITPEKLNYIGAIVGGLASRNFFGNGVNPIFAGGKGGAFGLNVNPINPFGNAGAIGNVPNVFGLGVQPLVPTWVLPPNSEYSSANPSSFTDWGNRKQDDQEAKDKAHDAGNNLAHIWFEDTDTRIQTVFFPTDSSRLPDRRYFSKQSFDPIGWPTFPRGYYGISLTSSINSEQRELWQPTDPRLVAANYAGPPSMGTPVADMGGPEHSLSLGRHAPLQSMMRVIREPVGGLGMLKQNASPRRNGKRATPRNWLAWNIGPSGQGDVCGGLVADIPTARRGTISKEPRVLGHVSCHYGGPLDVAHFADIHAIGHDADGNPINPVHISTDALYRRRDSGVGFEDGPIFFESRYYDGDDLLVPLDVHFAWNPDTSRWEWWSTSDHYVPTGRGEHTRDPKPPGEPTPPPVITPPEEGEPGEADPDAKGPTNKGPTILNSASRVGDRSSAEASGAYGLACVRETMYPSILFRPQIVKEDAPDLRYSSGIRLEDIRENDKRAPTTLRLEAWGAQGGLYSDGYRNTGGEWSYTQEPKNSRSPGGTSNGGLLLIPSEVDMSDVDESFAPAGLTRSTVYLAAGPGARIGVGLPELAAGGLRSGVSLERDTSDSDLLFHRHDATGSVDPATDVKLLALCEKVTKGAAFVPGDLNDVADDTLQFQVGVRTDVGNEALAVNIGGVVFTVAVT